MCSEITYRSIDNDAEVIDQVLSVEEVVRSKQKVPRQRAEPRQSVDAIHSVTDVDDLLKTLHLYAEHLNKKGPSRLVHYFYKFPIKNTMLYAIHIIFVLL